jgi:segregation and condensation protein A
VSEAAPPDPQLSEAPPATPREAFRVALPNFEGPLDLLLHLIKEHELDIFDIPIALVTEKYLEYLAMMREVNLEIAGEFLVMAASLAHIKSRLLLPVPEPQGEAEPEGQLDPRAELVRRLLEYQKYREAGASLASRSILNRDVFVRRAREPRAPQPDDDLGLVEIDVFRLIQALESALQRVGPELRHEIVRERVRISDAIHAIIDRLQREGTVSFLSLVQNRERNEIVATFLAILEMCKLKLIRLTQDGAGGEILLVPIGQALSPATPLEVNESEYR